MTSSTPFMRKVFLLVAMAVLLVPLAMLGKPSSRDASGNPVGGGTLANLRTENRLGQSDLGEIDPTGETMKLATLGLRGVATNILWTKAINYQKVEDWTALSATLEQITKLQPNFIRVWEYQGWNLSYNVSVEWDNYRDRYFWVIKGIDFLKQGTRYNAHEPRLLWTIGRTISQKIGRADERREYRQLFKDDSDFHGDRPYERRDNWLVGREWYHKAEDMVETESLASMRMSPLLFYSQAPLNLIYYAKAMEEEAIFDEKAREAWKFAHSEWNAYGDRELETFSGTEIRLNDIDEMREDTKRLAERIDELAPGVRERLAEEKRKALTETEITALETPLGKRTETQMRLAARAEMRMKVGQIDVYNAITDPNIREKARSFVRRATNYEQKIKLIERNEQEVNYPYWLLRSEVEATEDALAARRNFYEGDRAVSDADSIRAREKYEEGFKHWRAVLDRYPRLVNDGDTGEEIVGGPVIRYRRVLEQIEEPFPEDFILQDLVDIHKNQVIMMTGGEL